LRHGRQDPLDREDLLEAFDPEGLGLEDLRHAADRDPLEERVFPERRRLSWRGVHATFGPQNLVGTRAYGHRRGNSRGLARQIEGAGPWAVTPWNRVRLACGHGSGLRARRPPEKRESGGYRPGAVALKI